MIDKELADKIVALGVGKKSEPHMYGDYMILVKAFPYRMCTKSFVRDWRAAGALMEKLTDTTIRITSHFHHIEAQDSYYTCLVGTHMGRNESLPLAINEACVEALDD